MSDFDYSILTVLRNEGGYSCDPADPGGETSYGISKRSYPQLDIKALTLADAEAIYRRDYWKFGGILSQQVATKLFDAFVNLGHTAIKYAQEIVGVAADGEYGPNTEAAINKAEPTGFLTQFRARLAQHYTEWVAQDPARGKFLNGLLKRAEQ